MKIFGYEVESASAEIPQGVPLTTQARRVQIPPCQSQPLESRVQHKRLYISRGMTPLLFDLVTRAPVDPYKVTALHPFVLQMGPAGSNVIPDLFASLLRLGHVCSELPSRDTLPEHLVQLLVGPALGLRVVEVEVDAADDRLGGEDECRLSTKICASVRVSRLESVVKFVTHWLCPD